MALPAAAAAAGAGGATGAGAAGVASAAGASYARGIGSAIEGLDMFNKSTKKTMKSLKDFGNTLSHLLDPWMSFEDAAYKTGRTMAMSRQQAEDYTTVLIKNTQRLGMLYGKTFEEIAKYQESYSERTGRNIKLSKEQTAQMAAFNNIVDEATAQNLVDEFDKLGIGIGKSLANTGLMQERAKALGLNANKAAKGLADNIKLASKYSFKNGIKDIEMMVLKAQSLRMNMDAVMSAADKFLTLESAIETSANLQVLGGGFGQAFGNPLTAMYQANVDPKGFMESIVKMVEGKGTYNARTNQVEFDPVTMAMLRETAKQLNMSVDQLTNPAMAKAQDAQVDKELLRNANAAGFDNKDKEAIRNLARANFNEETGKHFVTILEDGETKEIEVENLTKEQIKLAKDSQLTEEQLWSDVNDIKNILKETMGRAKDTKSMKEGLNGIGNSITAVWAHVQDALGMKLASDFVNSTSELPDFSFTDWIKDMFSFAEGGIVPDSNVAHAAFGTIIPGDKYAGDKKPALLNSGEMVLNQGEQKGMFDLIKHLSQIGINSWLFGKAGGMFSMKGLGRSVLLANMFSGGNAGLGDILSMHMMGNMFGGGMKGTLMAGMMGGQADFGTMLQMQLINKLFGKIKKGKTPIPTVENSKAKSIADIALRQTNKSNTPVNRGLTSFALENKVNENRSPLKGFDRELEAFKRKWTPQFKKFGEGITNKFNSIGDAIGTKWNGLRQSISESRLGNGFRSVRGGISRAYHATANGISDGYGYMHTRISDAYRGSRLQRGINTSRRWLDAKWNGEITGYNNATEQYTRKGGLKRNARAARLKFGRKVNNSWLGRGVRKTAEITKDAGRLLGKTKLGRVRNIAKAGRLSTLSAVRQGGEVANTASKAAGSASKLAKAGNALKPFAKVGKFASKAAGPLAAAFAIGSAVSDFSDAKASHTERMRDIEDSKMSDLQKARAKDDAIRDRNKSYGKAAGGAVGAAIGTALGSFIPIPVVGNMIGAWAGEKVGSWLGGTIGGLFGGNNEKKYQEEFEKKQEEKLNSISSDNIGDKANVREIVDVLRSIRAKIPTNISISTNNSPRLINNNIDKPNQPIGLQKLSIDKPLLTPFGPIVLHDTSITNTAQTKTPTNTSIKSQYLSRYTYNSVNKFGGETVGVDKVNVDKPLVTPLESIKYSKVAEKSVDDNRSNSQTTTTNGTIKLDVSGTIKLDLGGQTASLDINKLLDTPEFQRKITDVIMRNLNESSNGGRYNMESARNNMARQYNRTGA